MRILNTVIKKKNYWSALSCLCDTSATSKIFQPVTFKSIQNKGLTLGMEPFFCRIIMPYLEWQLATKCLSLKENKAPEMTSRWLLKRLKQKQFDDLLLPQLQKHLEKNGTMISYGRIIFYFNFKKQELEKKNWQKSAGYSPSSAANIKIIFWIVFGPTTLKNHTWLQWISVYVLVNMLCSTAFIQKIFITKMQKQLSHPS